MKLRFPLLARILGWFFLNLLLLVALGYGVFRAQFSFGLDLLLAGRAGDRLQALADGIAAEIGEQPRAQWGAVLDRFGAAHGAKFLLFRQDGTQLAGEPQPLPPRVRERFGERRGPPGRFGPPADDLGNPPLRRRGLGLRPFDVPPNFPLRERPPFMVRTENPTQYWVGIRVGVREAELPRLVPAVLLIVSSNLHGGGLFFDFKPWIVVGGAAVAVSVLFWLPLVRGITHALAQTTRATERIAEGKFDVRVPAQRRDELGQLGEAVNHMAQRLEGLVNGQKRFLGDIAHELCSPIARIQMALGILEQRADAKQQGYVSDVREEVQHMSSLVAELLSFSKASLGSGAVKCGLVNLRAIAEQALSREAQRGGDVHLEVPADLVVHAAPDLLQRALANVIRNAIQHAGDAGPIVVAARRDGSEVALSVVDSGPGVPAESLPKLFDPFYRVDTSRARETGGVGLGLTIVKTCVEACGGRVTCRNREPRGFEVSLFLAVAQEAPAVTQPAAD